MSTATKKGLGRREVPRKGDKICILSFVKSLPLENRRLEQLAPLDLQGKVGPYTRDERPVLYSWFLTGSC